MKPTAVLVLGICILILIIFPVHALQAINDRVSGEWCPLGKYLSGNVLINDIPSSDVTPVLVEQAKYGEVVFIGNRIMYIPQDWLWDDKYGQDSFVYRTFDGQEYSNEATVTILLSPHYVINGMLLEYHIPKDTTLTGEIPHCGSDIYINYIGPNYGTLNADASSPYFEYTPPHGFQGFVQIGYSVRTDSGECGYELGTPGTIKITVGNPQTPVPEFPSMFLPATLIIGFLGAVMFIKKTK